MEEEFASNRQNAFYKDKKDIYEDREVDWH